jgi:hypothetical protein
MSDMPLNTALPPSSEDWAQLYAATLHNLRSKWPNAWPGLPVVLNACIQRLWPQKTPTVGSTCHKLLQAALVMAAQIEQVALAADYEPLYHNRLHTADALTAICLLIQALQKKNIVVDDEWAAAFLFAVTSHDVLHPGGANGFLQEIERRSAKEMQYIATPLGIDVVWLHRVRELILRTDPALVTGNHDKVQGVAFEMNLDWACVLINEADILASATSRYGPALGHALANEWAFKNHPLHQVVGTAKGRLQFLSSLRFSSPAAEAFQVASDVTGQIASLREA